MRVRVVRPLCQKGQRVEPGTVLDLPDHEAREGLHRGVVERTEETPPAAEPMTTDSVPELVEGKPGRRRKEHA